MSKKVLLLLSILLSIISLINSNHTSKVSYTTGSNLSIKVGPLFSKEYIIPFTYNSINICNDNNVIPIEDSIGDILTGESLYYSKYETKVNETECCKILCYNEISNETKSRIEKLIEKNYTTNWYIDELPAGLITYDNDYLISTIKYFHGIPLGYSKNGTFYIYNHLQFHIILSKIEEDKYIVVGFNILPISIKHNNDNGICSNDSEHIFDNLNQPPQELIEGDVLFTNDIIYEESDISASSRRLHIQQIKYKTQLIWINASEFLVLLISLFVIFILQKILSYDINLFNNDEYEWKENLENVITTPPERKKLLISLLGIGTQLFLMIFIILIFSINKFITQIKLQNVLNYGLIVFLFMGIPCGYVSSTFYRFWGGHDWIHVSLYTSLILPLILSIGGILIKFILYFEEINTSYYYFEILSILILWIFCTLPFYVLGGYFGVKSQKLTIINEENRVKSQEININNKPWYLKLKYMMFIIGFIGFITIFVEFSHLMAVIWEHETFIFSKYFTTSFILFIIINGEMSIIFVFLNITISNYNWWWKSFIVGCTPVIYLFFYSIYYLFYLKITGFSAILIYFVTISIILVIVSIICGSMSLFFNYSFLNLLRSKLAKNA